MLLYEYFAVTANSLHTDTANIEDFFEGDIILTPDQRKQVIKDIEEQQREMEEGKEQREHDIHARAVVRDSSYLWPNAVIPYVISSNLRKH